MAEKVTIMALKVDLQCPKCYKKVKKLLSKYPQIRDQVYDEKANTVIITVVCCSPEKIRDKLCCKGGGTIKSIDIKEPEKKKQPEKAKAVEPEIPKAKPPADPIPLNKPKHVVFVEPPKPDTSKPPAKAPEPAPKAPDPAPKAPEPAPKAPEPTPKAPAPAPKAPEPAPKAPVPVPVPIAYPPAPAYPPYGICYVPCYGYDGQGHGMGMPGPRPCNCGCGSRSVSYDNYGNPRSYCVNGCDYFSEENPSACAVM